MRKWLLLWLASAALAAFTIYWRFPADTGQAHWSEWAAYYGGAPLLWPLIWLAAAALVRRINERRGQARRDLSAVNPWLFSLAMTAPGWLPSANSHQRRFVQLLCQFA
jgi:hypothetical protein